jgi:hypothetical protein
MNIFGAGTTSLVLLRTLLLWSVSEIEFEFFFASTKDRCSTTECLRDLVLSSIGAISILVEREMKGNDSFNRNI